MTERWLISVPAWGARCVDVACATTLPALEAAVAAVSSMVECRVIVHTDQPRRMVAAATGLNIETRPVPAGLRDFDCLSQAHREVMHMALCGDAVVLLTADLVISRQGLVACFKALRGQTRIVLCASVRALQEGQLPSTSSALMRWAWENRHPITQASTYPHGDASDLSRLYFADEANANVFARLALPHPLAVRVDGRPLSFTPTVDANLLQNFATEGEMHLVKDCKELALVELSPRDKAYQRSSSSIGERAASGGILVPDPKQRWCFRQRVCITGDPSLVGADIDV